MSGLRSQLVSAASIAFVAVVVGACTDTVYQDRSPYNPPPDSVNGYLGYYDASQKQTTCGNCHVGQQGDWIQTGHSNAWDVLVMSGAQQPSCDGCHSLTSRGNAPVSAVGYDKVKDPVYQDVQCESCHGPGYKHVVNPSVVANRPLPSILIYPNASTTSVVTAADTATVINTSCGSCHSNAPPEKHHNYLKEWLSSRHGQLNASAAANVAGGCPSCHEAKGILAAWGVNTAYKQQGTSILMPQGCPICHDPHGTAKGSDGQPLPGQLRFPINTPVEGENLCTHCHNRTSEPAANNSRGPHGAQGPTLFGTAGYFPPGTVYDTTAILTTHGSTANPRLCAGCHVNSETGVDDQGDTLTYSGHAFHPLPCLMQKVPPIVDTTFTNACPYDVPSRTWAACTASGCHPTEAVAKSRLDAIWAEKESYLDVLWVDLNHNQKVDAYPADTGYLAKVQLNAPNDLDFTTPPYSTTMTAAKGALFNAQLTGEDLASHPDGSHGVHNPFLYRALLLSSLADMLVTYPTFLPAPPAPILSQLQAAIRSGALKVAPRTEAAVMGSRRVASE